MAKLSSYFSNNKFGVISWGITLLLVSGLVIVGMQWKKSAASEQVPVPQQISAPEDEPVDITMPALGGPDAFLSIARQIQIKTNVPADKPRYQPVEYRVTRGDSIFAISESYKLKPETVLWANYDVLQDDPHSLKPGMVLNIPPADGIFYQCKENDTLESVSNEFKATIDDILNFPGNDNMSSIVALNSFE